ncbi:pyridoxal phosphate-dependent aminotransferase [Caldivirga maquilingensis]|uniref:pyridoxal phosphate-dependent aminotransferase n=1 Tax=Caldivirga maquilingensis TaxID=76887 RepID=UPI00064E7E5A|nr:pyridoxal phosphate-dependent aminotransferase [Caldivirga maquilingensis]
MRNLSDRISALRESPTRRIDAIRERLRRENRDIIVLSAGQPSIPPPPEIRAIMAEELAKESMDLYAYTPSQGIVELREAVSEDLKRLGSLDVKPDDIVIVAGGQEAMFATLMTILNPGDEVILMDPTYFGYKPLIEYFGARIKRLRLSMDDGFRINVEALKELISSRTKAIILVSPDNPTGSIISEDVAKALVDLARDKDFWIISDEAYRTLIYEGSHVYLYKYAPEYVISLNTFSKDPGIPGWRLGFVYGPREITSRIKLAAEEMTYCPPSFAQRFVATYLRSEVRLKHIKYVVEQYRAKRDTAVEAIRRNLPEARFVVPKGSMFIFVDLSKYIDDSDKFAEFAMEKYSVALVPGSYFSEQYKAAVRVSFVWERTDRLVEGIRRLAEAAKAYKAS